jgi:hypothetical protein
MFELLASGGFRRLGMGRAPGVCSPSSKRWGFLLFATLGLGCNSTDLCAKGLCEPREENSSDSRDTESRGSSDATREEPSSRSLSTSGESLSDTTETSSAREGSTSDVTWEGACDPVSERGCDERTPWCVGNGAVGDSTSNSEPRLEPRCVECEEDVHCNFPFVERGDAALCVGHRCVACDLTNDRGCTEDAPYCVVGRGETLGDASVGLREATCDGCSDDEATSIGAPRCVECETDAHCTSAKASRCDLATNMCVACDGVGQCSHLSKTPACDVAQGTCVECTLEESDACEGRVCSVAKGSAKYHTCSEFEAASTGQCGECVSDEQCLEGYKCVLERFPIFPAMPTGRRYCMLEMPDDEDGCFNHAPFIASFETRSVGGVTGRFCQLRRTTCTAYLRYKTGPDVVPQGMPGAGSPTCFTDDSCSLPEVRDGVCVEYTENVKRCTYRCTDESDCPQNPPAACDVNNLCSVND